MTALTLPTKNPISVDHPDYDPAMTKVRRCRDAYAGSDAIKAAGTLYLPALSSHREPTGGRGKYEAYLQRALWYGATRRTAIGLSGAATVRPPRETATGELAKQLSRSVVERVCRPLTDELFISGRAVVLVNHREDAPNPTATVWWAESVRNWAFTPADDGSWELVMLVLEDREEEDGATPWEKTVVTVRHGFAVVDGQCHYWKYHLKDGSWKVVVEKKPLVAVGGRPVDHVPAVVVGATTFNEPDVEDPLLIDLVDVNISHYQNSADLELGRHWTALPTAWASGFPMHDQQGNPVEFAVGGENAWITDQPGAQAGYLEFSGAGLGHLSTGMAEKRDMMAVMGARLLEEPKASVESAETLRTRHAGERSVMARVGKNVSRAATWTLRELLWWRTAYEIPDDETTDAVEMQVDLGRGMTPEELTTLTGALQAGGISYATYFVKLQAGEVIPPERTLEEETALIDEGRPGVSTGPSPFGDTDPPPDAAATGETEETDPPPDETPDDGELPAEEVER